MPAFRDYRTRIYDNYYDEIIRLFKLISLTEGIRREILKGLGNVPEKYQKMDMTRRLRDKLESLSILYPDSKVYFDVLLKHMVEFEHNT